MAWRAVPRNLLFKALSGFYRVYGGKPESLITLSIKIAQKPYIIGSLGPKSLKI